MFGACRAWTPVLDWLSLALRCHLPRQIRKSPTADSELEHVENVPHAANAKERTRLPLLLDRDVS
jgi:hypothetical protein